MGQKQHVVLLTLLMVSAAAAICVSNEATRPFSN